MGTSLEKQIDNYLSFLTIHPKKVVLTITHYARDKKSDLGLTLIEDRLHQ